MDRTDVSIAEGLRAEEDRLLAQLGEEEGYVKQAFGMFRGPLGWPSAVLFVSQMVMFVAGVWFAVQFFAADDSLAALKSGLPAAVLILGAFIAKLSMWPQLHSQRVLRELRRLELVMLRD